MKGDSDPQRQQRMDTALALERKRRRLDLTQRATRKGGARAGVISLLTRPLDLLAAIGDRIGVGLVRPRL